MGFDVDLLGTCNVLEAARLIHQRDVTRPAVTKVLFPSSIASFGAHLPDGYSSTNKRRRVYPRGANNERVPEPVLISIDVIHISLHP